MLHVAFQHYLEVFTRLQRFKNIAPDLIWFEPKLKQSLLGAGSANLSCLSVSFLELIGFQIRFVTILMIYLKTITYGLRLPDGYDIKWSMNTTQQ